MNNEELEELRELYRSATKDRDIKKKERRKEKLHYETLLATFDKEFIDIIKKIKYYEEFKRKKLQVKKVGLHLAYGYAKDCEEQYKKYLDIYDDEMQKYDNILKIAKKYPNFEGNLEYYYEILDNILRDFNVKTPGNMYVIKTIHTMDYSGLNILCHNIENTSAFEFADSSILEASDIILLQTSDTTSNESDTYCNFRRIRCCY